MSRRDREIGPALDGEDAPATAPALAASRRRERLAVLGVVVLLLGAVTVPQAFVSRPPAGPAPLPDDGPPMKPSLAGEFRGIVLQLHAYDEANIPFEQYVGEIAETGANTLCLSVAAYQQDAAASSVFIEYRKVPSLERIRGLIRLARRRGMRVILMPIVLLENPGPDEWRGKISPGDPKAWWEDYQNIVLFYAYLAQETGVEVFIIGSELVSMEDPVYTPDWRRLIRKVRGAYSGRLCYSANWDHYTDIEWWRELDLVGMTSYYDLVGEDEPSLEVLLKAWKPIKRDILEWQRKVGLPIIFTEVGWASQVGCAKEPWNYYASTTPDLATQALCFEAFFRTWRDEPTIAGMLIWEWRNHPGQVGGEDDTSYVPTGKPAMKHIREYFQTPSAWDRRPAPASAPAAATGAATTTRR